MSTLIPFKAEREDLGLHVDVCAERYKSLDERLTNVEKKLDGVITEVKSLKVDLNKTLVTTAGTIIVAVLGLIVTILMKF